MIDSPGLNNEKHQNGTWRRKETQYLNERYHFYNDNDVYPICRTFISRLVTEPAFDDNIVKCRKCNTERSKHEYHIR